MRQLFPTNAAGFFGGGLASFNYRSENVRVFPFIITGRTIGNGQEKKSNLHLVGVCVNRIGTLKVVRRGSGGRWRAFLCSRPIAQCRGRWQAPCRGAVTAGVER